jgi:hypothetical protein
MLNFLEIALRVIAFAVCFAVAVCAALQYFDVLVA